MGAKAGLLRSSHKIFNRIRRKCKCGPFADDLVGRPGRPGSILYRVSYTLILSMLVLTAYATIAVAFCIYVVANCPSQTLRMRVLWQGNYPISQFYSGLALSIFFTPVAVLVRQFSGDLALLHPFALASKKPIAVADLDVLMNPGLEAWIKLFKYSKRRAAIQALIMFVGASLVPIGTLLVFPGTYGDSVAIAGVAGMPTVASLTSAFSVMDQNDGTGFSTPVVTAFRSESFDRLGKLQSLPAQIGPIPSVNLTYEEGIRYNGIVTYQWNSSCQRSNRYKSFKTYSSASKQYQIVSKERTWTIALAKNANLTHGLNETAKDQTIASKNKHANTLITNDNGLMVLEATYANGTDLTIFNPNSPAWLVQFFGTNDKHRSNSTSVEWLMWGPNNITSKDRPAKTFVDDRFWYTSVRCTPTIDWEVSNCLFKNGSFTHCVAAPGKNTTELDIPSLDGLQFHMGSVAEQLIRDDLTFFDLNAILAGLISGQRGSKNSRLRVPHISDFDNMYGLIAKSIISVATSGSFGVAQVPATGPRPALFIRTYILGIITTAMILTPLLPATALYWDYRKHRMPFHRATFLTVTNATRGEWWDKTMYGTCIMKHSEIRKSLKSTKVMFGVTLDEEPGQGKVPSQHVGLAPEVASVDKDQIYYGVQHKIKMD